MHAQTQLNGRSHDRKSCAIISSRQKHGRKRPWLDSAAYLSIIYIKCSKINPENMSIVSLSPRGVAPKLIKPALKSEPPSISSRTPARLKLIVAAASIRINTVTVLCSACVLEAT